MAEAETPKKLVIIDGKSVFYRGYYAMPNLSMRDGTPTGGVFGFATMALQVIKQLKPDYVCVAWDKPKTNIRKRLEIYPAYKAGRKPPPPDFYDQIPILHEVLDAFGWPLYELDDYEADDIMGTLAHQAGEKGLHTLLVTSDMDMLQVVNGHTKVFALKKGLSNIELFSPKSFEAKYGVRVDQFLDLKSLMGDSSDNIPGAAGIGKKTATQLLNDFETIEGVYENLGLIKDSVAKKLEASKDMVALSKKLASIWLDAPIKLNLKEVDGSKCDPVKLRDLLQKLEFKSLVRQLPEVMQVDAHHNDPTQFVHDPKSKTIVIQADKNLDQLNEIGDTAYVYGRSAGKHGRKPSWLFLSKDTKTTYVLNLNKLTLKAVAEQLGSIKSVIGYDVKAVLEIFIDLGVPLPVVKHDVLIGSFLINCLRREQALSELASADIGYDGSPLEELHDDDLVARASEIIAILKALHTGQEEDLKSMPEVAKLAKEIEWPVIPVLAEMEYEGIKLDVGYLETFNVELEDDISDLEQQIYGHANKEFNIASPSQLSEVLFEDMNLPTAGIKKGKTAYSTAASELDKLRGQHEIIDLITKYREVTKLKSTYVDPLPKQVDKESRLHTTFALTVAQTGRLSSNDPNLQNIPTRTDLGRRIRTAFTARPQHMLVSADYSQFELRLAAYLADDKELIDMFNKGADIHTATAAQVYGRKPEDVTKQMRRDAKVINFGVLYGMSPHGLVQATGMTYDAAKNFIEKYFEIRKPILDYMNNLKEAARKDGYVATLFGRRRPMPDIHSSNFMVRQAAERAAINMPIQGTEADLMKMAMVEVNKKLGQFNAKQLLQIHDSILVEVPEDKAEEVAAMMKQTMEDIYDLPVALTVDTTSGRNWGEL
jgi:DNA polymerase I